MSRRLVMLPRGGASEGPGRCHYAASHSPPGGKKERLLGGRGHWGADGGSGLRLPVATVASQSYE